MIPTARIRELLSYEISMADLRNLWDSIRRASGDQGAAGRAIVVCKAKPEHEVSAIDSRAFRVIQLDSGAAMPTPDEVAVHPVLWLLEQRDILSFELALHARDTKRATELVVNNFEMLTPFRSTDVYWCSAPNLGGSHPYLFVEYVPKQRVESDLKTLERAGVPVDGLMFGPQSPAPLFFDKLTPFRKWSRRHSSGILWGCLALLALGLLGTMLDRQERHQLALESALLQRLVTLRQLDAPGNAMLASYQRDTRFPDNETPFAAILGFLQSTLPPEAFIQSIDLSRQSAGFVLRSEFLPAVELALRKSGARLDWIAKPVSDGLTVIELSFAKEATP